MIGLALVIEPVLARRRIDGHPADGIHDCRRSIKAIIVVVET
jgi:hypothetical protein